MILFIESVFGIIVHKYSKN